MEHLLTHPMVQNRSIEANTEEWKSSSIPTTDTNSSSGFDCSICLDTVHDPVVTMCGHLYCWPCIYKWIHQHSVSPEASLDHHPQCPVCKAEVSEKTLIPLYGPGQSMTPSDAESPKLGPVIPNRPRGLPCGAHATVAMSATMLPGQHLSQQVARRYPSLQGEAAPAMSLQGGTSLHPVISIFGEICPRFLGESETLYTCPNSYGMAAMGSARARRHVVKVDQSLSRLSFFLLCCLVLCLVLF